MLATTGRAFARLKNLPLVYHPEHPITQLPATRAFY